VNQTKQLEIPNLPKETPSGHFNSVYFTLVIASNSTTRSHTIRSSFRAHKQSWNFVIDLARNDTFERTLTRPQSPLISRSSRGFLLSYNSIRTASRVVHNIHDGDYPD
jgi:hypothetical protein